MKVLLKIGEDLMYPYKSLIIFDDGYAHSDGYGKMWTRTKIIQRIIRDIRILRNKAARSSVNHIIEYKQCKAPEEDITAEVTMGLL